MNRSVSDDGRFMDLALTLAGRGLGNAWPNPAVGCVIVKDGAIVGRGWTQPGGRPHAETEALLRAGDAARGATAYVTLEPCAHHGRTGPCADALLTAGIGRAVVAIEDPDPRVAGQGIGRLRAAGIPVEGGVSGEAAAQLQYGFLKRMRTGLPGIALKLATSLDGRIATRTGHSQWITCADARARGHLLRARHDAILIGSGTALTDDPELTCRVPGLEAASPVRVVADSRLRLPAGSKLARGARQSPAWVLTGVESAAEAGTQALINQGVEIMGVALGADGRLDIEAGLRALAQRGITRVLVEGGAELASALLRRGLIDRVYWFRAALAIGADGLPALPALGLDALGGAPRWRRIALEPLGEDILETYAVGA